jgi:hypothetical protein
VYGGRKPRWAAQRGRRVPPAAGVEGSHEQKWGMSGGLPMPGAGKGGPV